MSKQKKLEFIRTSGNAGVLFWLFFLERFPVFLVGDFILFIVEYHQLIHEGGGYRIIRQEWKRRLLDWKGRVTFK